jgi:hypothetical protein
MNVKHEWYLTWSVRCACNLRVCWITTLCVFQEHYFREKPGELALALSAASGLPPTAARSANAHYAGGVFLVLCWVGQEVCAGGVCLE